MAAICPLHSTLTALISPLGHDSIVTALTDQTSWTISRFDDTFRPFSNEFMAGELIRHR